MIRRLFVNRAFLLAFCLLTLGGVWAWATGSLDPVIATVTGKQVAQAESADEQDLDGWQDPGEVVEEPADDAAKAPPPAVTAGIAAGQLAAPGGAKGDQPAADENGEPEGTDPE